VTEYIVDADIKKKDSMVTVFKGDACEFVLNKLQPAQTYRVRVQAVNAFGPSAFSAATVFTTPADRPLTPIAPKVGGVSHNTIKFKWEEPGLRGAPITSYTLTVLSESDGSEVAVYEGPLTSFKASKLEPSTAYRCSVLAHSAAGDSEPSGWTSAATSDPPLVTTCQPPKQPAPPKVVSQTTHAIKLQWTLPSVVGGTVKACTVQMRRSAESADDEAGWSSTQLAPPATSYEWSKLDPSSLYEFRLFASSKAGDGPASTVVRGQTAAPTAGSRCPGMMSEPSVELAAAASIAISWAPPEDCGSLPITAYHVEMGQGSQGRFACIYNGANTSHVQRTLSEGSAYRFRIRAVNKKGPGPWTEESALLKIPAAPRKIKILTPGNIAVVVALLCALLAFLMQNEYI
jgi:predicted phage tail protein